MSQHEERRQNLITDADADLIAQKLKESLQREAASVVGNGVMKWVFDKLIIGVLFYVYLHWGK